MVFLATNFDIIFFPFKKILSLSIPSDFIWFSNIISIIAGHDVCCWCTSTKTNDTCNQNGVNVLLSLPVNSTIYNRTVKVSGGTMNVCIPYTEFCSGRKKPIIGLFELQIIINYGLFAHNFFMLNSTEHEITFAHKFKNTDK